MDIRPYLNGCTRDWLEIIQPIGAELMQVLEIINYSSQQQFTPKPIDMFNFAKFPLLDTKVVILGMDPYPTPGDAHGLSFSSLAHNCPASVNRIFGTLVANNLLKKKPPNWNLTGWALQGVLLLNSALSVQVGKPGSHIKHWRVFMNRLLCSIINTLMNQKIIWCLWGNDAQQLYDTLPTKSDKHIVLRGVHPVAMVKPSFNDCNHFIEISKHYPDFIWDIWDPQLTEVHFYTDCSARNNQSPDCKASWGVVCTHGIWKGRSWNGVVETLPDCRPTNIRGEGFGLIKAFMLTQKLNRYNIRVKIFTDSKFWMDMLYDYIPRWVEQQIDFNKKKNPDIVQKIWPLFNRVANSSQSATSSSQSVTLVFVNAWHDIKPVPQQDTQAYANWLGNKMAEECAEEALGL
jgi:uracil-DNA glycosylase